MPTRSPCSSSRSRRCTRTSSTRTRSRSARQCSDGTRVATLSCVAVVTFLLSQLARKANDIVQAVFGWSVTALFGKLRRRAQILVTSALILSLLWPVFVIGVFAPSVSGWALALIPFHHWFSDHTLRIVWS